MKRLYIIITSNKKSLSRSQNTWMLLPLVFSEYYFLLRLSSETIFIFLATYLHCVTRGCSLKTFDMEKSSLQWKGYQNRGDSHSFLHSCKASKCLITTKDAAVYSVQFTSCSCVVPKYPKWVYLYWVVQGTKMCFSCCLFCDFSQGCGSVHCVTVCDAFVDTDISSPLHVCTVELGGRFFVFFVVFYRSCV